MKHGEHSMSILALCSFIKLSPEFIAAQAAAIPSENCSLEVVQPKQ